MQVKCCIVNSDEGYEGVITCNGMVVYQTGQLGSAEDADAMMEGEIRRNRWEVIEALRSDG